MRHTKPHSDKKIKVVDSLYLLISRYLSRYAQKGLYVLSPTNMRNELSRRHRRRPQTVDSHGLSDGLRLLRSLILQKAACYHTAKTLLSGFHTKRECHVADRAGRIGYIKVSISTTVIMNVTPDRLSGTGM